MKANELDFEEAMFLSIIYSFHAAAMQAMGKIANPFSGRIERNMDAARGSIDTLIVLQKRTKGNLTDMEERTLNGLIQELQLNYIDEVKRGDTPADGPRAPEAEQEPGPAEPEAGPAEPEEVAPEPLEGVNIAWLKKGKRAAGEPDGEAAEEKADKKTREKKK